MTAPRVSDARSRRALFVVTILTGSFLLFLVQPMIARIALPRLGEASAVWNSAMLVYQLLLLGGYGYAHLIGRFGTRIQARAHLAVLLVAGLWLPIGLQAMRVPPGVEPAFWVPWLLGLSIGPLFFAVSAQAPLVQRWYAARGGDDPYPLYAAANVGSFAGLIAYPLLVEPWLALHAQRLLWSGGYIVLVALMLACALALPRDAAPAPRQSLVSPPPNASRVAYWIGLSLVPSGLMLATSTYITSDLVAMPLLWVLPLGLYLLSFTIAFAARRGLTDAVGRAAPIAVLLLGGLLVGALRAVPLVSTVAALLLLLVVSVALHGAMYRTRPAPDRLTGFYFAMAVGGVLGGIVAGLIAPVLFDWNYEYPLLILAAAALMPLGGWWRAALLVALTAALLLFGGYRQLRLSAEGDHIRSYFGSYSVREAGGMRQLLQGTTLHGRQLTGSPARERLPTSYYVPQSGIGQVMRSLGDARIGVVGLGTGTLACYAKAGQTWHFYEIDPAVVAIARHRFTFLRRCLPDPAISIGDARLSLDHAADDSLDLLVLDAFSSESVPMHLLTREAFATYDRVLAPDGMVLVNISNRFLNLTPVLSAEARAGGWHAAQFAYHPPAADRDAATPSMWIALSHDAETLRALAASNKAWQSLADYPRFTPWRDDYSSILPLVR